MNCGGGGGGGGARGDNCPALVSSCSPFRIALIHPSTCLVFTPSLLSLCVTVRRIHAESAQSTCSLYFWGEGAQATKILAWYDHLRWRQSECRKVSGMSFAVEGPLPTVEWVWLITYMQQQHGRCVQKLVINIFLNAWL